MDLSDTIVALASASGIGARAIVRLSGPDSFRIARTVFEPTEPIALDRRCAVEGTVNLPAIPPWPGQMLHFPGPHSYTGQDMVELHLASAPPLVDLLLAQLMNSGARAARPGEFTMRAFLAGKRDLPRAEAVQAVIAARRRDDLMPALAQMAGGMTRPLDGLRDDLLNLLADIEAGLDFTDEDISFVDQRDVLLRITKAMGQIANARRQLHDRAAKGRCFRAALVGEPNAGKSSLFNALTQGQALVAPTPGTTRDYLIRQVTIEGMDVELVDTAGWQPAHNEIDRQAQQLGAAITADADLLLACVEAGREPTAADRAALAGADPPALAVATQCDRAPAPPGFIATSAVTGTGLDALRSTIAARARTQPAPGASSESRCRHHLDSCLAHLRRAHAVALFDDPPEILALELREALQQLGELTGAVYTNDLLDRIFSRFCIGK